VSIINDILDDSKTENISTVDLTNKTSIADYFIIATCRSSRHADSTADEVTRQLKKIGIKCPNPSGRPQCDWVIVDAGSVIIHLFRPEIRELYSLEKLWGMSFETIENKLA
jgi:ribosome-associated protein|tara:strand:- start:569 stop:901 length:333 start_codon:yes stop_codon:yes gene_type:complete